MKFTEVFDHFINGGFITRNAWLDDKHPNARQSVSYLTLQNNAVLLVFELNGDVRFGIYNICVEDFIATDWTINAVCAGKFSLNSLFFADMGTKRQVQGFEKIIFDNGSDRMALIISGADKGRFRIKKNNTVLWTNNGTEALRFYEN